MLAKEIQPFSAIFALGGLSANSSLPIEKANA